ncbi:MAG: hypothetical protein OEX12_05420 [Gammaproteobacteria bacterium]|nr:hypothetical protein [Gammaproteobacteria bacterium]
MDETEYRDTYQTINETRCWFEKAINSRKCLCARMERFNLADREGVRCTMKEGQLQCHALLAALREKALFALQITKLDGPLPHAKEVKVQLGGMLGLQAALHPELSEADTVADIYACINEAIEKYTAIEQFPFVEIIKTVVQIEGRTTRRKDRRK